MVAVRQYSQAQYWTLMILTPLSLIGCICIVATFLLFKRLRKFPANIVLYTALCMLLQCLGPMLSVVASPDWVFQRDLMCRIQASMFGCGIWGIELWNMAFSVNIVVSLRYPHIPHRRLAIIYHMLTWSLIVAVVTAFNWFDHYTQSPLIGVFCNLDYHNPPWLYNTFVTIKVSCLVITIFGVCYVVNHVRQLPVDALWKARVMFRSAGFSLVYIFLECWNPIIWMLPSLVNIAFFHWAVQISFLGYGLFTSLFWCTSPTVVNAYTAWKMGEDEKAPGKTHRPHVTADLNNMATDALMFRRSQQSMYLNSVFKSSNSHQRSHSASSEATTVSNSSVRSGVFRFGASDGDDVVSMNGSTIGSPRQSSATLSGKFSSTNVADRHGSVGEYDPYDTETISRWASEGDPADFTYKGFPAYSDSSSSSGNNTLPASSMNLATVNMIYHRVDSLDLEPHQTSLDDTNLLSGRRSSQHVDVSGYEYGNRGIARALSAAGVLEAMQREHAANMSDVNLSVDGFSRAIVDPSHGLGERHLSQEPIMTSASKTLSHSSDSDYINSPQ